MNASREAGSVRWFGPVIVWLLLLGLLAVSCASAFVPMDALNTAVNLAIAAVMLLLLSSFLMDLMNMNALPRLAAASGLLWIIFLFTLTFADYWSRS
jgi:cytochrome c oxidase subunit IV